MSLLPYYMDDFYPSSYHRFGSEFFPSTDLRIAPWERSLIHSLNSPSNYLRSQLSRLDELEKQAHIGKDGFQVCLDVQHFLPNEISVKTEDNSIVVHAKHEEKKDDQGYISREFTRRYDLPKGFKIEDVTSSLSSDGILSIKCPNTPAIKGSNVRQVQIQQTGPAKKSIKSIKEKKEKSKA